MGALPPPELLELLLLDELLLELLLDDELLELEDELLDESSPGPESSVPPLLELELLELLLLDDELLLELSPPSASPPSDGWATAPPSSPRVSVRP